MHAPHPCCTCHIRWTPSPPRICMLPTLAALAILGLRSSKTLFSEDNSISLPLCILPEVEHASLFESDLRSQFGAPAVLLSAGWGPFLAGDLFFSAAKSGAEVDSAYVSILFASAIDAEYNLAPTPTILCYKLDKFDQGSRSHVGLFSKQDSSKACTPGQAPKMYALPLEALESHLRIFDREMIDTYLLGGSKFQALIGAGMLGTTLFDEPVAQGLFSACEQTLKQRLDGCEGSPLLCSAPPSTILVCLPSAPLHLCHCNITATLLHPSLVGSTGACSARAS